MSSKGDDFVKLNRLIFKSSVWNVAGRWLVRLLATVGAFLVARVLEPADYGIFVISTLIMGFLEATTQLGFGEILVQKQTNDPEYYDNAWTLNVIRGVFVATLIYAGCAVFGGMFPSAGTISVLQLLAIATLLDAFGNTRIINFQRDFRFHYVILIQLLDKIASLLVTVFIAYTYRTYLAFPAGIIAGTCVRVVFGYCLLPVVPKPTFKHTHELVHFSKWLIFSNMLVYISGNWDSAVIGRLLNVSQLGLYKFGKDISALPTSEVMGPLSATLYPGYALLKDDRSKLLEFFTYWQSLVQLCAFPAVIGLSLVAPQFVPIALGEKWISAVPIVQILPIANAINIFWLWTTPLYTALGRPNLAFFERIVSLLVSVVFVLIGVHLYGLYGAALGLLLDTIVVFGVQYVMMRFLLKISLLDIIRKNHRSYCGIAVMVATVTLLDTIFRDQWIYYLFVIKVLGGIVSYVFAIFAMWMIEGRPDSVESKIVSLALNLASRFSRKSSV